MGPGGGPVILEDVSIDGVCQTGACDWEVDTAASRMTGVGVGVPDCGFWSSSSVSTSTLMVTSLFTTAMFFFFLDLRFCTYICQV